MVVVVAFATLVATAGPAAAAPCPGGAFAPEHEYEVDFGKTLTVPATPNGLLVGAEPAGGVLLQTESAGSDWPSDEESWLGSAQIRYVNASGQASRQGGFRYTPNPDPELAFSGIDMFDYSIIEKAGCSDPEEDFNTVYVTVKPVLGNDTYNMIGGQTLTVPATTGLFANDKGHDPETLALPITTAQGGTLDDEGAYDGSFTYTPLPGFSGADSFTYEVYDLNFDSAYTANVTINVAANTTPPGAPPSVSAVPGNAKATVKWSAANGNGNDILSYVVTRGTTTRTLPSTARETTFTGLTNGTTYSFSVRARSAAGEGPAILKTATPRTVPGKPTGVKGTVSGTTITVTWTRAATNGAALTGSTVTASNGKVVSVSGDTNRATFSGMKPGSYTFRAKSKNVVGTGLSSSASPSTIVAQQLPTYTARFTEAEYRYLVKTAAHFGIPVNEVGKTGVAVIRYILAIAPHPPTRAAARPQNTGPYSTTARYSVSGNTSTMVPVSRYLVLNGNDTLKVGAALMQYFAALRGVR